RAVATPVVGEELALDPRDVDANRTLRFAGAALEAEVEHVVDAFVAEPGFVEAAGERQAECVGAAARRVFLLARRHVGRAHRSVERLAANAEAAAHLDGPTHAAVLTVVEPGRRIGGVIRRTVAKVGRERRRVDDLAGIEDAVLIEGALDGAERV